MKMTRKKGWAVCLSLLLLLTMVGCTGGGSPGASTDAPAEKGGDAEIAPATIVFRTWNPNEEAFIFAREEWEKLGTGIEIELMQVEYSDHIQTLKVNVASGEGPDLYGIQVGAIMKEFQEFTLDIAPKAKETWGNDWEEKFNPLYMEQVKGHLDSYYGLPIGGLYAGFLWGNMSYFEKYDLTLPTDYDELVAVSQAFRAKDEYPVIIGAKDDWINLDVYINIASDINAEKFFAALEAEASFADPEMVQALAIWQKCFKDGVFQDGALGVNVYPDMSDLFETEQGGPMCANGSWMCGGIDIWGVEGVSYEVFTIDWNMDGKPAPVAPAVDVVVCVNKETENLDAAWKFFSWFVDEGAQYMIDGKLQYLPAKAGVDIKGDNFSPELMKNLNEILQTGENEAAGYREITYPELKQVIADQLKALALDEVTPEQAAQTIEDASQAQDR